MSVLAGLPDNLARRRDASGEHWLSAGGRGYLLDPASPLARSEWLAIGDAQGAAKGARITAALPLETSVVERWLSDRIERRSVLNWTGERVEARLERRIGAITLATGPDPSPDAEAIADLLAEKALENLSTIVPPEFLARGRYAGIDALTEANLRGTVDQWLRPLLGGRRDLGMARGKVIDSLLGLLDWDARQRLDRLAPREFASPAGTSHPVDYPVSGTKPIHYDRWFEIVHKQRQPFVANTLGDIATVHRGYEDPPSYLVRARGQDAVLLGVVMAKGVNGLQLGERIDAFLAQERSALPLGMVSTTVS